jgi:hypothetical protein
MVVFKQISEVLARNAQKRPEKRQKSAIFKWAPKAKKKHKTIENV